MMLIWLLPLISAKAISSYSLCPEKDSTAYYERAWAQGDTSAYHYLNLYYSLCDSSAGAMPRVKQLMLERFQRGGVQEGLTYLSKHFSQSLSTTCRETKEMRASLNSRREKLTEVEGEVLDEMQKTCNYWGSN